MQDTRKALDDYSSTRWAPYTDGSEIPMHSFTQGSCGVLGGAVVIRYYSYLWFARFAINVMICLGGRWPHKVQGYDELCRAMRMYCRSGC